MAGTLIYDSGNDEFDCGADIDLQTNVLKNIGAAGTDFTATGGLVLADALTISAGGIAFTGAQSISTSSGALTLSPTTDVIIPDGKGLVIGHSAQVTAVDGATPEVQVIGGGGTDSNVLIGNFVNGGNGNFLTFLKSRNATPGSFTIVQSADEIARFRFMADDGTDYATPAAQITVAVDGTPGANDMPGRIMFATTPDGAAAVTEKVRITNGGLIIIGDGTTTSNAGMTIGLTINQGANSNDILSLKSSSVAHGMTNNAETDTFASIGKAQNSSGGLVIRGIKDADDDAGYALFLRGYLGEAADTTKTTAALGVTMLDGMVKSGSGVAGVGADGNIVTIGSGSTTRFIFDAEGSAHADVEWTTYDSHDDIQLLRDVEAAFVPEIFGQAVRYKENDLVRMKLFGEGSIRREPNGKMRGMMNQTRMIMLHHGAIQQVYDRLKNALEAIEAHVPELRGKLLQEAA